MKWLLSMVFALIFSSAFSQNVSYDKKLGAESAVLVEQEMGIYHHDSLSQLVNAVGRKLVSRLKNNPFEFKFFLADSPEPNAFALPGGYIYVTRGILPLIQSEDELAGIIAHEIIHVAERHSVKQMKKGLLGGLLQVPGNLLNVVTGTNVGNIINAPIALTTHAFVAKYSRGHEHDADKYGVQLAASAGYNPKALADALERLAKGIELITGKAEKKNYFSDHPFTPSRVTNIRKDAPNFKPVNPSPVTASRETFQKMFSGLVFGPNPQQGVFKENVFIQPDLKFSWVVPNGWGTLNKPSVVGAYTEQGDALVVLSLAETEKKIQEIGEEVKAKAVKSPDVSVEFAGDTLINSFAAYVLRLKSKDPKAKAFVELIWLQFEEQVVQMAGVYTSSNKKVVQSALRSFRTSTSSELSSIDILELQFVLSNKSETIGQLSERTHNKLNLPLTSLINDVDTTNPLNEKMLVKIVRGMPYKTKY
jgi:predicted Zn-dependent protease